MTPTMQLRWSDKSRPRTPGAATVVGTRFHVPIIDENGDELAAWPNHYVFLQQQFIDDDGRKVWLDIDVVREDS